MVVVVVVVVVLVVPSHPPPNALYFSEYLSFFLFRLFAPRAETETYRKRSAWHERDNVAGLVCWRMVRLHSRRRGRTHPPPVLQQKNPAPRCSNNHRFTSKAATAHRPSARTLTPAPLPYPAHLLYARYPLVSWRHTLKPSSLAVRCCGDGKPYRFIIRDKQYEETGIQFETVIQVGLCADRLGRSPAVLDDNVLLMLLSFCCRRCCCCCCCCCVLQSTSVHRCCSAADGVAASAPTCMCGCSFRWWHDTNANLVRRG